MKRDGTVDVMQVVMMPATLPPRAPGPAQARELLVSGRPREGLASGRAREALTSGAAWRRRTRLSFQAQRLRDRLHPNDLSIFTANLLRFFNTDVRLVRTRPTPSWQWVPAGHEDPGRPERMGSLGRLEPLQLPAFELPPRYQNPPTPANKYFAHLEVSQPAAGGPPGVGGAPGTSASFSGAAGACVAVMLLAALVLLARGAERFLDQRFFKLLRRRRSDEWFTPNVLATCNHHLSDSETIEGAGPECSNLPSGDPPPPYSMCFPKSPRVSDSAEPPPPYSACYVAFGGPQDPLPRVHLNVPGFNSFQDTGQVIETDPTLPTTRDTVAATAEAPECRGLVTDDNGESNRDSAESRSSRTTVV